MSSILGRICILIYFLTVFLLTINARSITDKNIIDNKQATITLANYRHRLEHSTNFKKLRWSLKHQFNKAYCQFCDLVVPVVSIYFLLKTLYHSTLGTITYRN
jgi:hypothetical protein